MGETVRPARPTTGITPFLAISGGRAAAAITFYEQAFLAHTTERNLTPDGLRVMQAGMKINGGWIMLSDDFPEHGFTAGPPEAVTLHLQVDNAETWFDRATAAGCTVRMALADQFWGDRYGQLTDPFGYIWSIGSPTP